MTKKNTKHNEKKMTKTKTQKQNIARQIKQQSILLVH